MAGRKIVFFLAPGDSSWLPASLAKGVVERSQGRYEVVLVSVSKEPGSSTHSPGVTVRRLAQSGYPKDPADAVSWEIPGAFADADLVHLHQANTRGAEVGLLAARLQGKPLCVTDHGVGNSPLGRRLGALDLADRVIATSDFAGTLHRTSAPLSVIRGGVDSTRFNPAAVPVTRDRILYVGPIHPEGIDLLIGALPPGMPLTVCGPPPLEDDLSGLSSVAEGKAVEFVIDPGPEQRRALYHRAWATVFPGADTAGNPHDGDARSPLRLLESLACGTPVVAARSGPLPEFVRDGETGFHFDNAEGLRERLQSLLDDPALSHRMGLKGRQSVERDLDHRAAGSRLFDVYEGLIGVRSRSETAA